MNDKPLSTQVSPRWEVPATVAGFADNPPNEILVEYAQTRLAQRGSLLALDIGGGAARNALPLAKIGLQMVCTDLSRPMLKAAATRIAAGNEPPPIHLVQAPMTPLPFLDNTFDLIVAHGIWNLARSGREFRSAVTQAARVAKPGAGLFLFTFARHTLPTTSEPVADETFVFDQFNGEPQCFLTEAELIDELGRAGFVRDSAESLTAYNSPPTPRLTVGGPPVLFEGTFIREAIQLPRHNENG